MSDFALKFIPEDGAKPKPKPKADLGFLDQFIPTADAVEPENMEKRLQGMSAADRERVTLPTMRPWDSPPVIYDYDITPEELEIMKRPVRVPRRLSRGEAMARSALQGATFGFQDEISAGVAALGGVPYSNALAHERGKLQSGREQYPVASTVAEIGGAVAMPFGAAASAPTRGAAVMNGMKVGGLTGFGYGVGTGEGAANRLEGGLKTGAAGALLGGAIGAVVPAAQRSAENAAARLATKKVAKAAPELDALRKMAQQPYSRVDAKGVKVRGDVFGDFAASLGDSLADEGIDTVLTPTAARGLKRILQKAKTGDPVTIKEIETLRRVVNSRPKMAADADIRLVAKITDDIDDFVLKLVDADVVSPGGVQAVGADLKEARSIWSRVKKSERISQAMEDAEKAASGFENGLRVEFRKILADKRFMAGATDAEKRAIREVTKGTKVGNWLKRAGRLGYGRNQQSSVLSSLAGSGVAGGIGTMIGGPALGTALAGAAPIIGQAALKGSEMATLAAAKRAGGLAAAGGRIPAVAPNALQSIPTNALLASQRGSAPVVNRLVKQR